MVTGVRIAAVGQQALEQVELTERGGQVQRRAPFGIRAERIGSAFEHRDRQCRALRMPSEMIECPRQQAGTGGAGAGLQQISQGLGGAGELIEQCGE